MTSGYWQKTKGGLEEIRFNQDGSLDYGSALPPSGTIRQGGSWTLACPTLTANINATTPYIYQAHGNTLTDQNGVNWVLCQPMSTGECF